MTYAGPVVTGALVPAPPGPASPRARGTAAVPDVDEALTARVLDGLDGVEAQLREAVRHTDALADAASRHLVEAGGKRVRPMLALLAAHLGDPDDPGVLTAAVAVELVHLASLYHDDVMDDAPLRRGAPSAQAKWGNDVAILTGDLLFARASRLVAELGPLAVRLQAETFERLCLGQMHETVGPRPDEDPVAHHLQVLSDKTGSLIALAGQFGAQFSGAPADVVEVMRLYGERVGVAFQLADDVLDLSRSGEDAVARTGKAAGTDLREGVPTLPVLLARRASAGGDAEAAALVELLDADLSGDEALATAVDALAASPYAATARESAREWAASAVEVLDGLPAGHVRDALAAFARSTTERDR
ncbi:polyprenyl synthetase family protein [Quadrisphaera sp. INWT6]|nr:polyprenyl synthetase family protein [Quadrisphaera sp. INWT6]